jgi:hypothetical protein
LVLERRAERSTLIVVASPLIAFALTVVTPAEESLLTVNHRPPTRGQHAPACGGTPAKFSPPCSARFTILGIWEAFVLLRSATIELAAFIRADGSSVPRDTAQNYALGMVSDLI